MSICNEPNAPQARADTGGRDAGDASPHQTSRGFEMTLDFIENHRQNIFVLHIAR